MRKSRAESMLLSMKTILFGSVFLLTVAAVAACEDDSMTTPATSGDAGVTLDSSTPTDTCATTGSGTVTVTATGLPAGAAASLTLTDASGAHAVIDGASIASGTYTVTANAVTAADRASVPHTSAP